MRKVLHVGPCDTPGGMATVMRTLADHSPEGWEAELLPSHAQGGLWAKCVPVFVLLTSQFRHPRVEFLVVVAVQVEKLRLARVGAL